MNGDADEIVALYTRRREDFASQLSSGNDPYIQTLLGQAIRNTDLCKRVLDDLTIALARYTKEVGDYFEQDVLRSEQITTRAIKSLGVISSISDEQLRSQAVQLVKQSTDAQLEASRTALKFTETVYEYVTLAADHIVDSLKSSIFRSGDEEAALKALVVLLEFLIGQIPVLGEIAGAYSAIRDIVDRQKDAKEATAYMKGLRDYATATFYWAASAQVLIDGITGVVPVSEEERLGSVVEKLTRRLEELAA